MCLYIHVYMRVDTFTYVCMYVCMYLCMHACMHACMYVCMYVGLYIVVTTNRVMADVRFAAVSDFSSGGSEPNCSV